MAASTRDRKNSALHMPNAFENRIFGMQTDFIENADASLGMGVAKRQQRLANATRTNDAIPLTRVKIVLIDRYGCFHCPRFCRVATGKGDNGIGGRAHVRARAVGKVMIMRRTLRR
jgi:hypothetical protein